jgi:hypothetical protein
MIEEPKSVLIINTDVATKKSKLGSVARAWRALVRYTLPRLQQSAIADPHVDSALQAKMDEDVSGWQCFKRALNAALVLSSRCCPLPRSVEGERITSTRHLIKEIKILNDTLPKSIEVSMKVVKTCRLSPETPQLHQVLMNAERPRRNARRRQLTIKAARPSMRTTRVNLEETGTLVISISDNGIGIPPHIINKIFEPFFQPRNTARNRLAFGARHRQGSWRVL